MLSLCLLQLEYKNHQAGMGIILQPQALVAGDLQAGRLQAVLPGYAVPALPVHLVTAPGRLRAPEAAKLCGLRG